jgi:hypothetical protein
MPFDVEAYVPQDYELIPHRFAILLRNHPGEPQQDQQRRRSEAAEILRQRAKHLTTLGREQGQQSVREYARYLRKVVSLMQGPLQWDAWIFPGRVDLFFRVDPLNTRYRIYTTHRRVHRRYEADD